MSRRRTYPLRLEGSGRQVRKVTVVGYLSEDDDRLIEKCRQLHGETVAEYLGRCFLMGVEVTLAGDLEELGDEEA